MEMQIIQFNRIAQSEAYKEAEQHHNGIKYGEYYSLLKRTQRALEKFASWLRLTPLTEKQKKQRFSKSTEFTTEIN